MKSEVSVIILGLLVFLCLSFAPSLGHAEKKVKAYTLQQAVQEALANNWALKAREDGIDQAENVRKQARADFLPKLGTSYGYKRFNHPISRSLGAGIPRRELNTVDNFEWRGGITQPLFTGFALISTYRLAELGIDQSELEVELETLDIALRAKETYFGILIQDRGVEVALRDIEAREENLKVVKSFYEVGMVPVNDLLRAEVELANSQQALVQLKNDARLARAAFNRVLARPTMAPVEVVDIEKHTPVKVDFEDMVEKALNKRPEIKLIDVSIKQTDANINLVQSRYYPEINLNWEYIKEGDEPNVSGGEFHIKGRWEMTTSLTWTLFEWGKTYYEVEENKDLKEELLKTRLDVEDGIRLQIREAILALDATAKNIPPTRKAVEQGEENLRVNDERYKAQVTVITDVLDAQTLLTQTRVNYYRALYQHELARARLERSLGVY